MAERKKTILTGKIFRSKSGKCLNITLCDREGNITSNVGFVPIPNIEKLLKSEYKVAIIASFIEGEQSPTSSSLLEAV